MNINTKKITTRIKRLKDNKIVRIAAIGAAGAYVYNTTMERQGYAMIKPAGHTPEGREVFVTPFGQKYTVEHPEV